MGYFKDALNGVAWMGGLRGSTRILAYIKIAVLARLLGPEEFGIFGIASLVLAFLEIITETGINAFLIQEDRDIRDYIDTAWIVSAARGLLISLLIVILAKPISYFFNSPDSYEILLVACLIPLIRGFINPSIVKFEKNLEFNKVFYVRLLLFFADTLVTIISAIVFKSAMVFLFGMIASAILELIISFLYIKPIPKVKFELSKIKHVVNRGKWLTLSGTLNYFYEQGKLLNSFSLGLYQMAYKISTLPLTEAGEIFYKVTFPVFVKIGGDLARLRKAFYKTTFAISIFVIPISLVLFVLLEPFILILLGANWLEIIPIIKILLIYGAARSISGMYSPLFLAVKKQEYISYILLISVAGMAITILPLIKIYGLAGAGMAVLFGWVISLPLTIILVYKVLYKGTVKKRLII